MKFRLPLWACLLTSCMAPENKPEYPIIARIVTSIDGRYQLANVRIETLTDVDHMIGKVGSIKGQAALNVDADVAEIMSSTDPDAVYSDRGHVVQTDYILQDGVVIPQNFQTMEMLGLYSAYERTVAYWMENFDIPFDRIGLPSLYYNPRLRREKDGEAVEVSTTMNAAYLPGVRDFWFFKTASREHVPVKMNFGVVAHEFGHYIFDYQFARFDRATYDTVLAVNENFLSGLNEGLSDYFSFAVTKSVAEFGASLPELDLERRLPVSWTLRNSIGGSCTGGFYCQGSVLASALYEIAQLPGQTSLSIAQKAYDALPELRANWLENRNNNLMDYSAILNPILAQSPNDQVAFCNVFRKWFDTDNVRLKLTCPN
jgi:hypothetical protein